MKKICMKSCIVLLIMCVLFSTTNAYAQDAKTEAKVEFTEGEGPTYPVDPEDPDTDIDTELPVTGSLAIVSVSDFYFNAIPLTTKGGLCDIVTVNPNIQVVDLRGSGTGWHVTAKVSKFTSGGMESLPGSVIHIYLGRPNSLSNSPAPIQTKNVALPADGTSKKVITAPDGTGSGLWVMRWYPEDKDTGAYIQLEVSAGAATKGVHTATIDWTLEDTP